MTALDHQMNVILQSRSSILQKHNGKSEVYVQVQIQFMPSMLDNKTLLCLRTGQNVVDLKVYKANSRISIQCMGA